MREEGVPSVPGHVSHLQGDICDHGGVRSNMSGVLLWPAIQLQTSGQRFSHPYGLKKRIYIKR